MKKSDCITNYSRRILDNIEKYRQEKNLSSASIITTLQTMGCNVNRNSYNDWKNGKSDSFLNYIGEICEILGISVEDIDIAQQKPIEGLSDMEELLIRAFRIVDTEDKMNIVHYALDLKKNAEKKTTSETAADVG